MRLRTKLVLTAGGLTFAIVLVLSAIFLGELLRQRVDQTYSSNEFAARQVRLAAMKAVENVRAQPPADSSPQAANDALHAAVADALSSSDVLQNAMDGILRYSFSVQDVSVTDAHGVTIVSTDPDAVNQHAPWRASFADMRNGSAIGELRAVFGKPRVLDISESIERNEAPFLVVHIGVSSDFLSAAYKPWLGAALEFALLATLASAVVAALLSAVALRPMQIIGEQLERLTLPRGANSGEVVLDQPMLLDAPSSEGDPVGRVARSIDRLDRQMRSREEGYTALQANLNQMLDTLRDGVLLFAPDRRAVMVSDAVEHFLNHPGGPPAETMVGMTLEEIFHPGSALGEAVLAAFERGTHVSAETVTMDDGRQVQISLDRIGEGAYAGGAANRNMGTLLTLRDTGSALELEQELEVARRLAAIGRLTANVGHEVKNPINAMVVHLELLRGKLATGSFDPQSAQKHVEILADEMRRLDRVVETLADFSRPMELDLREHDLRRVVEQTIDLAGAELAEHAVGIESDAPPQPVPVRVDGELIRQALLNLLLNAMQAMPSGGRVHIHVRRDNRFAIVEIADNGIGIPESLLPRVFDLYFTTKPRGSGIGLAMTYRILQLHGGSMEVRSDADPVSPARGTTFTLDIRLDCASVRDEEIGGTAGRRSRGVRRGCCRSVWAREGKPGCCNYDGRKGDRLIEQQHSARRIACTCGREMSRMIARIAGRVGRSSLLALVFVVALTGCRHKPVRWAPPVGALAPVELATPPQPEPPPEIATLPAPDLGPLPEPPPAPRRRPAPAPREQPQIASNETPALAIGVLSVGGDGISETQQKAQDLIASIVKRIAALSTQAASSQKREIRQIRNFLDQAQKALKSGDADGANALATKASLLMDNVEKK